MIWPLVMLRYRLRRALARRRLDRAFARLEQHVLRAFEAQS